MKNRRLHRWTRYDLYGAALCASMAGGVFCVSVLPMLSHGSRVAAFQQDLAHAKKTLSLAQSTLNSAEKTLAATKSQVAGSALRLEPASHLNLKLAALNDLAAANGLSLLEVQPGAARPDGDYDTVPITLSGTGSYKNCTQFLKALHAQFSDLGVEGVDLAANPAENASAATFHFRLCWFALPQMTTASVQ